MKIWKSSEMDKKYASLCLLTYKRPDLLPRVLSSLWDNTAYPYQLIINIDGGDKSNLEYLMDQFSIRHISNIIINNGDNRGVGRSFQNCLGLCEGDYIFKIDADIIFTPGWLEASVKILEENSNIGAISPFDYNHYDPNDERFKPKTNHVFEAEDHIIVKDFVSSIYGFRKEDRGLIKLDGTKIPDDGVHSAFPDLAITKRDYVRNEGFGVTKSVYISGTEDHPFKTPTFDEPLILKK